MISSPSSAGCPSGSTAHPNSSAPSRCCWSRTSRPTLRCTTGCIKRYRDAVDIITDIIKRGQSDGRYRTDVDAANKAVEILAFINGMETLWLLDPSIPLAEVFKGYAESLGSRPGAAELDMRYRLDVVAPTVLDAVRFAGGWIYDRVMAGWDVTVLIGSDEDVRPLQILGAQTLDLESVLEAWEDRPHPQTVAVAADLFDRDPRVLAACAQRARPGRHRGDAVG